MHQYLLFIHVAAMALWLGGAFALNVLMARGSSGANPALGPALGPEMEFFGKAVFLPLTLVVLASGAWLVDDGGWDWDAPFVVAGVLMVVISLLMGPLWMMRNASKLKATIAEHGPTHADVAKYKARLRNGAMLLLVLLFVTAYMMVVKPGG
jgi:uncharacterized membrane protein